MLVSLKLLHSKFHSSKLFISIYNILNKLLSNFSGKIRYYTEPPETTASHISADIVTAMSKEFDIDGLTADENESLKGM